MSHAGHDRAADPPGTTIEIEGITAAQANAIRRTLVADVPKLAIEDVEFHLGPIRDETSGKDYDSSTSMFDEGVALRLGLLPIPTDLSQFRRKSECTCEGAGCVHCQVMYLDRPQGAVHGLREGRRPAR